MSKPINGESSGSHAMNFYYETGKSLPTRSKVKAYKIQTPRLLEKPPQPGQAPVVKQARVYTPINAPQAPVLPSGPESMLRILKHQKEFMKRGVLENDKSPDFVAQDVTNLRTLIANRAGGTAALQPLFDNLCPRSKKDLQFRVWYKDGGHNNPLFGDLNYGERNIRDNPDILFQGSPSILDAYLEEVEHQVEVHDFFTFTVNANTPQQVLDRFNNHLSHQVKNDLRYRVWYKNGGYKDPNFQKEKTNYGDDTIQKNIKVLFEGGLISIAGCYYSESYMDTNHTWPEQEKLEAFHGPSIFTHHAVISQLVENQRGNADLQAAAMKRAKESKLDTFYKTRNITEGNEKIQVDTSQLDFPAYPTSTEELRTVAKNLIEAINQAIALPVEKKTSVEARRYVKIDTTSPLFNQYDKPMFDRAEVEKFGIPEQETIVGYVLRRLEATGVIYKVEKQVEGGYVIQA